MFYVGIDAAPLKKTTVSLDGKEEGVFKAHLGVSVTTMDKKHLTERYDEVMDQVFDKLGLKRKKRFYKGAHLLMQTHEKVADIISMVVDDLEDCISHIDVYCAYYGREYISVYGKAAGQRLTPMAFMHKTQNAFEHVCAWWYAKKYSFETPLCFDIDHFSGESTPAWRELVNTDAKLNVYFSGGECNPVISIADLILKLIAIFHHGKVDGRTLLRPVRERCPSYVGKRKLWFHNLGDTGYKIKAAAPDIPLPMDLTPYLKHPIFFMVWDPGVPKSRVKKSFEWSPVYNVTANKAIKSEGGMKSLSFDEDIVFWDPKNDFLIPWYKTDKKYLEMMRQMGYNLPNIIKKTELLKFKDSAR